MLFTIFSTDRNGNPVERAVVDTSKPKSDGTARKDQDNAKGALRAYGCRTIRKDDTGWYAVGSRSGKRIWAEPQSGKKSSKRTAPTISAAKVKSNKSKSAKVKKSPAMPEGFDPTIHATDANGAPVFKADGTLAKRRGRKPGRTMSQIRTDHVVNNNDVDAPYGRKADGTPRQKPGRKPASTASARTVKAAQDKSVANDAFVSALADFTLRNGVPTKKELARLVAKYSA